MTVVATYIRKKDKTTAILLAFFLGGFGAHRFYLDQTGRGIFYLLFFWTPIPWIICFIDFIVFVSMSQDRFDWKYNSFYVQRKYIKNPPSRPNTSQTVNRRTVEDLKAQAEADSLTMRHQQLMRKILHERDEILGKLKKSRGFQGDIIKDIKPLLEKYVAQIKELILRDKKLKEIIDKAPLSEVDKQLEKLKQQASQASTEMLKLEYQKTIDKLEKQKSTITEFIEQREMVVIRIKSTQLSLEQIKFDLIRLEALAADEQRKEFTRMFEEKSADLSTYLDLLKENYETSSMN